MKWRCLFFTMCFNAFFWLDSAFGVPGILNYQGRLTDPSTNPENPIVESVSVTFTFMNQEIGGSPLGGFSDDDNVTPNSEGYYSTFIGDVGGPFIPKSVFRGEDVFLRIRIRKGGGSPEELSPRARFTSVPYALYAPLVVRNSNGDIRGEMLLSPFGSGRLELTDSSGEPNVILGENSNGAGDVSVHDPAGNTRCSLRAEQISGDTHQGKLFLWNSGNAFTIELKGESGTIESRGGAFSLLRSDGTPLGRIIHQDDSNGSGGRVDMLSASGSGGASLDGDGPHHGGMLQLSSGVGGNLALLHEDPDQAQAARFYLYNTSNNPNIQLKASTPRIDLIGTNSEVSAAKITQTSDKNLKKNVRPLFDALSKVRTLRGIQFEWKESGGDEEDQIGVIAQEIEKVFPEVVHTTAQGYKAVDYGKLVAPLIEAIKELDEKNREIESTNLDLIKENAALAYRIRAIEDALSLLSTDK